MTDSTVASPADSLADLFKLKFIQSAKISPNGRNIIFSVSEYDEAQDSDYNHLWLYNRDADSYRQITFGQTFNMSPAWSPDSQTIAFISTRSGKGQIYLLKVDGGEARPLTDIEQGVTGQAVWSPDGSQIAFTAGLESENKPDFSQPYRLTRHVYRIDSLGYADGAVQNIYLIDVESGKQKQITRSQTRNSILGWSPSGDRLLISEILHPDTHYADLKRLHILDVQSGSSTNILGDWGKISNAAWHPDGDKMIVMGWQPGVKRGSKADLYVLDLGESNAMVNRTAGLDVGVGGILLDGMPSGLIIAGEYIFVSKDGRNALVHVQLGGTVQLYRVALTGEESCEPIISGDRTVYGLGLDQEEQTILFAASDFNNPFELFLADENGRSEKQITNINQELLEEHPPARVEHLLFKSKHDVQVEGWLIMPAEDTGPFPTVVNIHGGPHCGYGHAFHMDVAYLVNAGYAVLMVNHRGSTGYGNSFGTALHGDWGNLEVADQIAGLDFAIEAGFIDPERVGVCGVSGGGYLSCWLVGHTHRFKAAVPENPVTNWHSFYGVSDIGVRFGLSQLGGHPHEIPETYFRCSPINYAHNCQTPTLLIQGEVDWRCPAEQSEQFYTALKVNDCPVEMLRLPNASHAGSIYGPPVVRKAKLTALLEWMNRYVLEA